MSVGAAFDFVRGDDFVEYFLFPQLTNSDEDADKVNNDLQNLLKQINQLIEDHTRSYIWHKDEFHLTVHTGAEQNLVDENIEEKVRLPAHLYGISHYGDNIQDEWFIVFLIFEITRKIPGIVGRVTDSDGEFLLIEAADFLPKWANPDTCEQRVYIYDGHLQLVQNSPSNTSTVIPVTTALAKIYQNPTLYRVSNEIQSCVNERLEEFTKNFDDLFHHQIVRVPLAVAAILKHKPSLIAPACVAFCDRDPIDMKACRAMRYFPPENRVRTNVKFTRCLFAMITHNSYAPDRRIGWHLPPPGTEAFKEDMLGVKIACGFEILASQAKDDDDIENDRAWKTYLNSLVKKGYFKNFIEGSKDHSRLLEEAKHFYKENVERFRTAPVVGKEILQLLRGLDINAEQLRLEENSLLPSDDDNWLNISSKELDAMLTKKYGIKKFYKANGDCEASEFTENITQFLDKKSDIDGIDLSPCSPTAPSRKPKKNPSMRKAVEENPIKELATKSNNEINFDPDAFQTHVKNFLDFVIPEDDWESNSEMSDYEDDDDLEKNLEDMEKTKISIKTDIKTYMDQMDKELAKTTIGKTFDNTSKRNDADDFDDIETFKPIDIDVNTLRNMVDSYKHQIGGPGPATNLLGAMGLGMAANSMNDEQDKDLPDINGTQV